MRNLFGSNRKAGRDVATGSFRAIHVGDFADDFHDPFEPEPGSHYRWLATTCIAGVTGCLIIAGAIVGLFGDTPSHGTALASVDPGQIIGNSTVPADADISRQRSSIISKSDFDGQVAQIIANEPLQATTVAYQRNGSIITPEPRVLPREPALTTASVSQYLDVNEADLPYQPGSQPYVLDGELGASTIDTSNITTITKTPPPEPTDESIVLSAGETLASKLQELGINPRTAQSLTAALEPVFPAKLLRTGQRFTVTIDRQQDFYGNEVTYPVLVNFSPGPSENIVIEADEDGRFIARIDGAANGTKSRYASSPYYMARGNVRSSLYSTALDRGVPDYIINEMTKAFSFDIDFQRQVQSGDEFEIFYGEPLSGSSKNRKVLHYAKLDVRGKPKTYFRFTTSDGKTTYYDETGRSASSRSLMRTPISGARISSGFGMRRHPILGYSKMHTGMDFAVPAGTPIRAAGSGVIKHAAWRGAYGRAVMIKHSNGYTTLYAHMSRIASGLKRGQKVQQGQVIGYVGSTGRSTGPHLHYEVRRGKKPINPRSIKTTSFVKLQGKELERFKKHKARILALGRTAPSSNKLAQVSE